MKTSLIIAIVVIVVVIAGVLILRSQSEDKSQSENSTFEEITLQADDGTQLAGNYLETDGDFAVILLHMMPATKESYEGFAKKLKDNDFTSLAIDLRGHGESERGPDGYKNFANEEHQASIQDVRAASQYLKGQGFDINHQLIVGASIGANLALQFVSDTDIPAGTLLSPGFNYSGIETKPLMENVTDDQALLIAASEDDQDRAQMARELIGLAPGEIDSQYHLVIYENAGHGTDMFGEENPPLQTEILRFFERNITP